MSPQVGDGEGARVNLPELLWRPSPNYSSRQGASIDLLVWHETAGSYLGSVAWLRNPRAQASALGVLREDGGEFSQLVRRRDKAWHAAEFNRRSIGVEHANVTAKGYASERQLRVSARVFGWLCLHANDGNGGAPIPPRWARHGQGRGVCYHGELGAAGGGHTACGPEPAAWLRFLEYLHAEIARGGFRDKWAR